MSEPAPPIRLPRKQTGVPRRFGVGVMLLITTMYAVLFSAIKLMIVQSLPGAPTTTVAAAEAVFFVVIVGYFTMIGLSQALLYKGRNPRRASIVTSMVLAGLVTLVGGIGGLVVEVLQEGVVVLLLVLLFSPLILLAAAACVAIGGLVGYLVGRMIAGTFLLLNRVQPPLEDPEDDGPSAEKKIENSAVSGEKGRRLDG